MHLKFELIAIMFLGLWFAVSAWCEFRDVEFGFFVSYVCDVLRVKWVRFQIRFFECCDTCFQKLCCLGLAFAVGQIKLFVFLMQVSDKLFNIHNLEKSPTELEENKEK